jgi:heme-degrading monooxygenase HmoA
MAAPVLRIWRGTVAADRADDYQAYLMGTGVREYLETAGNRAGYFTRRTLGDKVEFCMVTVWDDLDAVRAFAGDDPDQAVFYPEDDDYLIDRELVVSHYDVFASGEERDR